MKTLLFLFLSASIYSSEAVLEGFISLNNKEQKEVLEAKPTDSVTLSAQIKNQGSASSPSGMEALIRFSYPPPLDQEKGSILYESETIKLPLIAPHETITIHFKKPHTLPTFHDFFRKDYGLRKYQLIVRNKQKEVVLGKLIIAPSGHYYPGHKESYPHLFDAGN